MITINQDKVKAQRKAEISAELDELQAAALTPRGMLESMIALAEKNAEALGISKKQLYLANPAYKGWKDAHALANTKRAELKALK